MASLFGSRSARASEPSVPLPTLSLSIQTSIQGKPRPMGWGMAMLAGNVLDLQDFTPVLIANYTTPPSSGGHKGGIFGGSHAAQPTITYTWIYFCNTLISLCEGPIQTVTQYTTDGITLLPLSTPVTAGGSLTTFLGTQTQTPWTFMQTAHPANALAYRGEAYLAYNGLALGDQTVLPNFKFEIKFGICGVGPFPNDANPRDVILDFVTNQQYGIPGFPSALWANTDVYANYCLALGLVVSPIVADQIEASQFIRDMLQATNSELVNSNGLFQLVPYGDEAITANGATYTPNLTPLYTLQTADFMADSGGGSGGSGSTPVNITRISPQDLVNNIRLEYIDRSQLYITVPVEHKDEASITATRERPSDVRQAHMFCLRDAASMSAGLMLTREQVANTYTFTLPKQFILLDPMDLVTLPLDAYGLSDAPQTVRIKEIQENSDYSLTFTAEDFLGVATAPLYPRQNASSSLPDFSVDPGNINPPVLFEMPDAVSHGLAVYAAVSGSNPATFGGCDVYSSTNGVDYVLVTQIKGNSRMGVTTTSIPAVASSITEDVYDQTSTLGVDLTQSQGTLISVDPSDLIARSTLSYVGGELIAYQNVTLTSTYHYDISPPIMRGAYGSKISTHAPGVPFVRVDGAVARVPFEKARAGSLVYLKFVPFNVWGGGQKQISDAVAYTYTLTGVALQADSPEPVALDEAVNKDFVDSVNHALNTRVVANATAVAQAGVTTSTIAIADANQAFASYQLEVASQFEATNENVTTEHNTNVNQDTELTNHSTRLTTAEGTITTHTQTFADNATAFSEYQTSVTAQFTSTNTNVTTEHNKNVDQDNTLTNHSTRLTTAEGTITTHTQTFADNATAFSEYQTSVTASFTSTNSNVTTEHNKNIDQDNTLTNHSTRLTTAEGTITTHTQTFADNATAFSTYQTSVTASFNDTNANVTSNTTAINNVDGKLSATWQVTTNVSNKITGIKLYNDGSLTTFDIQVDKFNIWSTGFSAVPVFSVSTIAGSTAVTIDGTKLADLTVLNRIIENNGVSNSASSTGNAGSGTGNAVLTARAGARVLALLWYGGNDFGAAGMTMHMTINGTNGPNTSIPFGPIAGGNATQMGAVAMQILTVGGAGTVTASGISANGTFSQAMTIYLQELSK